MSQAVPSPNLSLPVSPAARSPLSHPLSYLYLVLNELSYGLVAAVGAGVGTAVVVGSLRCARPQLIRFHHVISPSVVYGWRLRYLILLSALPALGLSIGLNFDAHLRPIVGALELYSIAAHMIHTSGLAWDCGAATTGPVTVPIVLALGTGLGVANGQSAP